VVRLAAATLAVHKIGPCQWGRGYRRPDHLLWLLHDSDKYLCRVNQYCRFSESRRTAGSLVPVQPAAVGCSTAAILVVGIGYHALLREVWAPQGVEWVANLVLHYIVPAGALLHWLAYPYADRPKWWTPLSWCWYPLAYFAYVMTRGEFLFSYPYPFIDVLALGYVQTILNAIGLLIGFIIVGYLLLGLKLSRRGFDRQRT
jgi:hypothetical protein